MSSAAGFGVLHLTAELWPYARTGGLGQAVADLAAAQARGGAMASVTEVPERCGTWVTDRQAPRRLSCANST